MQALDNKKLFDKQKGGIKDLSSLSKIIFTFIFLASISPLALAQDDESSSDEAVFTLGEIIVVGKKSPAERTSSIEEISSDDIEALGAKNVADALQIVTSARVDKAPTSISANGKQESLISLRGFDPRNVIVLIDGVPVYEPYFRVLDLKQIPVGSIAKIQVIKGATSVLYGPNALGGIINIITKKGAEKPKTHLDVSYGDVETYSGSAYTLGAYKGVEYFFSPSFAKSDGFLISQEMEETRNEDGGVRENSDYSNFLIAGKLGYGKGLNSLTLSVDHYEFSGGIPYSMEAIDPATLWRQTWNKTSLALHGEFSPVKQLYARAKLFYSNFQNTITTYENTSMSAISSKGKAVSTYDNDVMGYSILPEINLGKAGTITFAGHFKYDTVSIQENKGEKWRDYGAETYSAATQYDIGRQLFAITSGIAYHFFRRTKTPTEELGEDNEALDYQIGFALDPLQRLGFKVAFAKKSAFPDLKTLYGSQGNPNLKPEYTYNLDAGIKITPIKNITLESTYFYSYIFDLIGKKEMGNTFTYENINEALINGVESNIDVLMSELIELVDISFGLSHTYMQTEDKRPKRNLKSLDFRPEHKFALDARLNFDFGLSFDVQYLYVGKRKYEEPTLKRAIKTMPEYGITNARIAQQIGWNAKRYKATIFLEGKNIFDVYYEESPERASPGRNIVSGLAIDF